MNKENITTAFAGKILGVRNYRSDKSEFLTDDFLNEAVLDDFLDEVYSGEGDITPAGKSFLKNYFGFEELAQDLLARNPSFLSIKSSLERKSEVASWLEKIVPMEIGRFVEESRGTIEKGASLKDEFLPPQGF